jgi:RimJ/RimL family protein N-acetyltransferase
VFTAADCSRAALKRWMVWYHDAYGLDDARSWIDYTLADSEARTGAHFAICGSDGSLLGVMSLEGIDDATGRAMLGYWVATPATGQGIARRSVEDVLGWARKNTLIDVVWAVVAEENGPSRRVLEANAFTLVRQCPIDERGDRPLIYERAI